MGLHMSADTSRNLTAFTALSVFVLTLAHVFSLIAVTGDAPYAPLTETVRDVLLTITTFLAVAAFASTALVKKLPWHKYLISAVLFVLLMVVQMFLDVFALVLLFAGCIVLRKFIAVHEEEREIVPVHALFKTALWVFTLTSVVAVLGGSGHISLWFGELWYGELENIQMLAMSIHPYVAAVLGVCVVVLLALSFKVDGVYKKTARGLTILTVVQAVVGIGLSHMADPSKTIALAFVLFHLAWGALLFMASLGALTKVYWGIGGAFHSQK